ncbi:MAG: molybdopterin-dependent oxidoreductase [Egibacteraceae bacterium]
MRPRNASSTLDELKALPTTDVHADFHCVTKFSVFDNDWHGVRVGGVLRLVELDPDASNAMVHALDG